MRKPLIEARRIVIKVGSSLLTAFGQQLDIDYIQNLSTQVAYLRQQQRDIVIVSSGAVIVGMRQLKWSTRPNKRTQVQVAAAVGQMGVINAYRDVFSRHHLHTAQILLTAAQLSNRTLYLNARTTLRQLLENGVIPVVNENDVIATDLANFGDNDHLAAQIANLIEADVLLLLTDVPGLCRQYDNYDDVIYQANANDQNLLSYANNEGGIGLGGMKSKLNAAAIASRSGAHSLIINGKSNDCLKRALSGDPKFGTWLVATTPRLSARKQWLASGLHVRGKFILDEGAIEAVLNKKRSLLAAGLVRVDGQFARGDCVLLSDCNDCIIGYALANYDSTAACRLCGIQSDKIHEVLGFAYEEEIAHRDNMSII